MTTRRGNTAPSTPAPHVTNANDITRWLLAFQPYRGTIVRREVPGVITKEQIAALVADGYLDPGGTKKDPRFHFTNKAYRHLGRVIP